jgi:hypothetical protein
VAGIQVQRFDTDAADTADSADRSGRIEPSSTETKNICFVVARGEFTAPGTISLISLIRRIRVEPLNLDASNVVALPSRLLTVPQFPGLACQ